jgi:hypothetical protein
MRRFSVTYLKGSGSTLSARIMYPGLMVRAVSTQAAEVSTSSIQYFFSTYLILLSSTYGRVQRCLTSAYDFQVETYGYRVKIAFYTAKLEIEPAVGA